MLIEKAISRSLRVMFSGGIALGMGVLAMPAMADDAMQRVEVTGSNIKRAQSETASPVQVISRDDIVKSGKATVAEYLQTLTSDGAGSLPTGFGNGFAAGSTAVSLRGLGATSTLVLLNGRRMASFGRADDGQKTFTDLSTIPMELVQRIEILKDGASSVYGADAIAGVINIILRKDFEGTTLQASTGETGRYRDNRQTKGSITAGKGNLENDGFNINFNLEAYKSNGMLNKDRADRDYIGHGDLRAWGYPLGTQFASGQIRGVNDALASPVGAIRNPANTVYQSLPGCSSLSTASPQDPGGGCLWYADQFRSMQPDIEGVNVFGRGVLKIDADTQLYAEAGFSKRNTAFTLTPPSITPTVAFPPNLANPSGVINFGSGAGTTILMAASHPQNPFGADARIRYQAFDVGAQVRTANNSFNRMLVGVKGNKYGWDYDAGLLFSQSFLHLDYSAMLNMAVVKAALGDPKSPYFPYYIGAQASKNPASLYAAMVTHAVSDSTTQMTIADFKASRELMQLEGGAMGLAVGAEFRREYLDNPSLSGTSDGTVNASYVSAKGDEKIGALYAEILAPVLKSVELSGALRYDRYSSFNSTTPKFGIKWSPVKTFAARATYSEGFRAPGPAESGSTSQSTGTATALDPVRCPGGVPRAGGATLTDCAASVAAVKVGDPNLRPEKSKGMTFGLVWDPLADTSMSLDGWRIKRSDEINPMTYSEAAALPTAIRADNNLIVNGVAIPNTGSLLISKAPYRNSSYTEIKGYDFDIRQRVKLGDMGRLTADLRWTHIQSWKRVETNGTVFEYAGTHGNCDTSNCAGTPKDKVNVVLSWDVSDFNLTSTFNYRAKMKNVLYEGATSCASLLANGTGAPGNCEIDSFTTMDLSGRWNINKQWMVFGSIQNVTDKIAPLDPLTYGGMSYNPMDASGAIGRMLKIGAKYQF